MLVIVDRIDKKILTELQVNGRISNIDLSKKVGLSPTPCLERVRRLERTGVIEGYQAVLNAEAIGANMLVFVEITLEKTAQDVFSDFSKAVEKLDEILECHLVSGSFDYLLKTRVKNMASYRKLLGETLLKLPSVSASRTYVVMEEVKSNRPIPIYL
ncbi:leucine-responsive transcriptional regulator Lrp [Psychrosphaera ytuae]|uniref:Leucine-responsive regulatory protein n=1 Tax=Psychrosphaera ytuae TaxID=2820710 RepID=A0A975DDP8_9GAMM|nr:leucine-responsive transcriptional regulator Lrp [Psychrosphaera ytuae]QTH65257.1 leucine-responsive transcriptional regulator Lrp [Psychrosphaera ytuae]